MAAPNPVPDSHPSDAPILVDPDDPSVMFEFQRLLHRLGAKSTITDDFTPTANAEQLAALLVDSSVSAKVWPAFKASMPALIVKASEVPPVGGGARGILQRALLEAGLLVKDWNNVSLLEERGEAQRNWQELRLTRIFGSWARREAHYLASALSDVDVDEDWQQALLTSLSPDSGPDKLQQKLLDVETMAIYGRVLARLDRSFRHSHQEAVDRFTNFVQSRLES